MQATVEENLKWGFALYSSPGSFDPACDDPVTMADFINLVHTMARYQHQTEQQQHRVERLKRMTRNVSIMPLSDMASAGELVFDLVVKPLLLELRPKATPRCPFYLCIFRKITGVWLKARVSKVGM